MRLFLSSYRAGRHNDKLIEFLGGVRKIAVITNAKDYKSPTDRKEKIEDNFSYYRSIGLDPTEIDLRPFFHKSGAEKRLSDFEFVWLAGGNAFLLRRALKYSGIDKFLISKVRSGSIIYGGESAGAIIASPTLHGSEDDSTNEDDPNYVPRGYDPNVLWDGLGLIDYVPVPHYKSPDIGDSIDDYIDYLKQKDIAYKTMTDDQAIVVDGDKVELLK